MSVREMPVHPRSGAVHSHVKQGSKAGQQALRGPALDVAVFKLLTGGKHQAAIAKKLAIAKSSVSDATARMVRAGYVREAAPGARPAVFARGPRAEIMDRLTECTDSDRGGRSSQPAGRLHRQEFRCTVDDGPRKPVSWERDWNASGVRCYEVEFRHNGKSYKVRETRGKRKVSLKVSCPEEWVLHDSELPSIERMVMHEATQVFSRFAEAYGYTLKGEVTPVQPPEVAFGAQGLPRFGRPGVTPIHVDASKGEPELETAVVPLAQSIMRLPDTEDRIDRAEARLASFDAGVARIEAKLSAAEEREDRLLRLLERQLKLHDGHQVALVALAEGQVMARSGPPPEPPPVGVSGPEFV